MLLAVEGGGFFFSSALGYSKGLTLLLLGHRGDEKHMRVVPWNQYKLVVRETGGDLQLASGKNQPSRGCASFVCFGRASAGLDGQSPLKVGPTQLQDITLNGHAIEKDKELSATIDHDNSAKNITLKSSLKKSSLDTLQTVGKSDELEPLAGVETDPPRFTGSRNVQWKDAYGKDLAEIREFEPSETGESDDEFINGDGKTCSCSIM